MPLIELAEPDAVALELKSYNEAGPMNRRADPFELAADTAWVILGTPLLPAVVVGDVPTLKAALDALDEINVAVPLLWGHTKDVILNAGRENVVHATTTVSCNIVADGGKFSSSAKYFRKIKPGLNTKFCVWGCTIPAALTVASLATLKAAVTAVTGITSAIVLMDGVIPSRSAADATVQATCHLRLDTIPEVP